MPRGLGYITMQQQTNSTSCWITAAQFCMRCLGQPTESVEQLIQRYQAIDASSSSAMSGAGKPATIIEAQGVACRTVRKPTEAILPEISAWVAAGKPVIVGLTSAQVAGWNHAVVVVGATANGITLGFKDPARRNPDSVTYVSGQSVIDGFKYANAFQLDVFAYCRSVTFVG